MVLPFSAVTRMVTALFPGFKARALLALPLTTNTLFTLTVALASLTVGVRLMLVEPLPTKIL